MATIGCRVNTAPLVIGQSGKDPFYSGKEADRFIFTMDLNTGRDRIMDFEDGLDWFSIEVSSSASFEDLTIQEWGRHTYVSWDTGSFWVMVTDPALIGAQDFVFS